MPEHSREFICPHTEDFCVHGGCVKGKRCIQREREEAAFHQAQAAAKERRLRPRIDPVTGNMYVDAKPEDLEGL
jgi:hypothetical protein